MNPNESVVIKQFSPKFAILEEEVKKTFKGFRGGRASGKSWAIARKLIGLALKYRFHCVCARAFWTNLAESAYRLLKDTIEQLGLQDQFHVTNTTIRCKHTGAEFSFMGLNTNPAGIKSQEFNIVWVEEGEQITQEAWDYLIATIIRKRGATVICSWNPLLPTTPVEAVFDMRTNPDCIVKEINYLENPHLPEALFAQAERDRVKDLAKYEWIWLGRFKPSDTSTWIALQSLMAAIGRGTPACDDRLIVAGLDLGFTHDRSVLIIRQGLRILEVKIWRNATPQQLVDETCGLMARYNVAKLGLDCLGPGVPMVSYFREAVGDKLVPVDYGSGADDADQYYNKRSEAWGMIKEWLENGHIPTGMDADWITDMCNIRTGYDDKGRYSIEKKKLYIARGFPSTDMSDALGISLCVDDLAAKRTGTLTSSMRRRDLDMGESWLNY